MEDRYLCKAKDKDDGEWYEGYYLQLHDTTYCCMPSDNTAEAKRLNEENTHHYIVFEQMTDWELPNRHLRAEISPETRCRYTEFTDKNGKKIWENDITRLVLPNGEVRYFKVSFRKVVRDVLCHPDFDDDVAKVELNAVCFEWNGYDLFPCVDVAGISDVAKMEVVGNIFDNPELLEGDQK